MVRGWSKGCCGVFAGAHCTVMPVPLSGSAVHGLASLQGLWNQPGSLIPWEDLKPSWNKVRDCMREKCTLMWAPSYLAFPPECRAELNYAFLLARSQGKLLGLG